MQKTLVNWKPDSSGFYIPTLEKNTEKKENPKLPSGIAKDYNFMISLLDTKYRKEHIKICATYNKLFPYLDELGGYNWEANFHNATYFTVLEQERSDTGTGLSSNFLKKIIGDVVSRIGTTRFQYQLTSDAPTVLYTIYKDEIERILKATTRKYNINQLATECFHDAAILSFGHVWIDPWAGGIHKIPDYALGTYESEFAQNKLKRVMIRNLAFPVTSLKPYLTNSSKDEIKRIIGNKHSIDLKLYIDCDRHKKYVTINNNFVSESEYPFDTVQLITLSWDIGIRRSMVGSLFDDLYPTQRAMNKLFAKKTQLLAQYKGPVPIFNADSDIIIKSMGTGAGEALILDSQRNPATLVTVLNPTPLDPELNAENESLKAQQFEISGIQQISMDIENYRSAANVIALEQQRDSGFQSHLSNLADFIRNIIIMYTNYMATVSDCYNDIPWTTIQSLINEAYIDIKPISKLDADSGASQQAQEPDYLQLLTQKFVIKIINGEKSYADLDFTYDEQLVLQTCALRIIEIKATASGDTEIYIKRLLEFLASAYVEAIKRGEVTIAPKPIDMQGRPLDKSDTALPTPEMQAAAEPIPPTEQPPPLPNESSGEELPMEEPPPPTM